MRKIQDQMTQESEGVEREELVELASEAMAAQGLLKM